MELIYTAMLVGEKFETAGCAENLVSTNPKEIVKFLKRNRTVMGFTLQYGFHRTKRVVVEIHKKGRLVQRDIKSLLAQGFDEWQFNWAWAGHSFRFADGTIVKKPQSRREKAENAALETNAWKETDLITTNDVIKTMGIFF